MHPSCLSLEPTSVDPSGFGRLRGRRPGAGRNRLWALTASFLVAVSPGWESARAASSGQEAPLKVTAYKVWASGDDPDRKLPEALRRFADQLKRIYPRGSFRLDGKPVSRILGDSKALSLDLPQGYRTRWTSVTDPDRRRLLRQVLVNPRKVESVALLKKSPAFTHLKRIRNGQETFLLIVHFQQSRDARQP